MTDDADFKRLVRERMEQTGESYTAARRRLRPDEPTPRSDDAGSRQRFSLFADDSERTALGTIVTDLIDAGGIELDADSLRVWVGQPASWSAVIPRRAILAVQRIDADDTNLEMPKRGRKVTWNASASSDGRTRVISRGAHGWRGKWLVNGSGVNLVRLTLGDGVRATVSPGTVVPPDAAERGGRLMRFFLKERSVKLTELTVSVDDPDALVAALTGD